MSTRAAVMSKPQANLAELLDRLIGGGVVAAGDLTLSVAGVELVYLNLRALLSSVATLEAQGVPFPAHGGSGVEPGPGRLPGAKGRSTPPAPPAREAPRRPVSRALGPGEWTPFGEKPKAKRDDEQLQRGLAQLVLTVTELLRELMERQALRRVEAGMLEPEQVDRLGRAFERLEEQMADLKQKFGFGDDDLTLRLGPVTDLGEEDE
jgi:Gas vesicle protein K/Gas vesicle protein